MRTLPQESADPGEDRQRTHVARFSSESAPELQAALALKEANALAAGGRAAGEAYEEEAPALAQSVASLVLVWRSVALVLQALREMAVAADVEKPAQ